MCVSEPLCAYYCSYSPGKKPRRIERTAISDAEPEGREVAEEHKKKGGETEEQCAERERVNIFHCGGYSGGAAEES